MRSAIITSPVNLVTAEAPSNRIIFHPASKSNVTRTQRKEKKKKKKKEKIHYESRRVNFSCQVDIEARIFFRRALDFIQRDRKISIGKLSFSFLPYNNEQ